MKRKLEKALLVIGILWLSFICTDMDALAKGGTVKGSNVNVRSDAGVASAKVGCVNSGDNVEILGSGKDAEGKKWYKIQYTQNSKSYTGYIRSDFVNVNKDQNNSNNQSNISVLDVSKYIDTNPTNSSTTTNPSESTGTQDTVTEAKICKGVVNAENVNVRKKVVSGNVIAKLNSGTAVRFKRTKQASDGKTWYYIGFKLNGKYTKGWIRSDFITVTETSQNDNTQTNSDNNNVPPVTDQEYETYLQQQGFPESYKVALRALHSKYPSWTFKAVNTNLSWNDVIAAECKVGMNLVSKNAIASWKSTESTAYNWKKNIWYTFDGGSWVAASPDIIKYYMDPRNFLDESSIFQFETLEYEEYQNSTGVANLLASSFMKDHYTEPDGTILPYADTFVEVGKQVGVSPYHLAARCYQEQGKGTSDSISGKASGYENIFNYYNIGAYAANGNSPVIQGLIYASGHSDGAANYERPWNTRYKSILGGAEYVALKYVKLGQNTLYFQKFNVVNTKNGIYKHQYMTNLQAAVSEAVKMSKAYTDKNTSLLFYIPVYKDMPQDVCIKPDSTANPNNILSTLEVSGKELTPVFDPLIDTYYLTVKKSVKKVDINATAVANTSIITGTGTYELKRGDNIITVICTSQSGVTKNYTINITRK